MTAAAVQVRDLGFGHGKRPLFSGLNLDLGVQGRGSCTAVVGGSGVGKSTLLRLLAGLERPHTGHVQIGAADSLVFLSQEPVLFEHLNASDNARYLLRARNLQADDRWAQLRDALGLQEVLADGRSVTDLSGGERQRLALMRALLLEPELVLLDEPCAGLDPHLRSGVIEGLNRAVRQSTSTVLYVTHHLDEILLASDQVLYLEASSVKSAVEVFKCPTEEFIAEPPTAMATRFARFPRCNLLRGTATETGFVPSTSPQAGWVAFTPAEICCQVAAPGTPGAVSITMQGVHAWAEVQGQSIAINQSPHTGGAGPRVLILQPGALIYDQDGRHPHRLDAPLQIG